MSVNSKMTALADEIRELSGTTTIMGLDAMASNIGEANDEISSQIDLIAQITSALEGKASGGEQATPEISINSTGLITATAGTKSSTHQLAFQPAKTITPSTVNQVVVSSGYYTGGNVTVAGDSNLVAGNIKSGVSIFGVNGILTEGGSGEAAEWSENEDAMVAGTLMNYTNDRIRTVRGGAFAYCNSLITVNLPNCTTIKHFNVVGNYDTAGAFERCFVLTTASFPACTTIGNSAFAHCYSLTTASFPAATTIGDYAFCDCSSLTTASFPACTTIGNSAFEWCSRLTAASFPNATSIGEFAFYDCSSLTTVSFPAATTIRSYAFQNCASLTTANFPVATSIGEFAFYDCSKLTTASFPVATTINNDAFYACSSLTTVSFPAAISIGSYAFYNCYSLTTASFPAVTNIGSSAFYRCSSLTTASFPAVTSIGINAFYNCSRLTSFYLTGSSIPTLSNVNAFNNTPMSVSTYTGSFGSIFVPASLVASYQAATNWATYADRITAIPIITFTIDGTEYQAEDGMTWAEWVESEYDTNNKFFIDSNGRIALDQGFYNEVRYNNISVLSNNEIIQDAAYIVEYLGGAGN